MRGHEHVRQALGDHLRRMRSSHGWTLRELAERVTRNGVEASASRLNRFENGETMPSLDLAEAVFRTLGVPLDYVQEIMRGSQARSKVDLSDSTFEALIEEGKRKQSLGLFNDALARFEAAYDYLLLREDGAKLDDLAEILCLLSDIYLRLRLYRMSLDTVGRVLNLDGISVAHRLRALLLHVAHGFMTGDFFRARLFSERAQKLIDGAEPELQAYAHGVIGFFCFKEENYSGAIPYLEKSRDAYLKLDHVCQAAQMAVSLGYSLYCTGHPKGGRRMVSDAYRLADSKRHLEVAAYALRFIGKMDIEERSFDRAAERFRDAARVARRLGLAAEEFMALHGLYLAETHLGEARKAGMARRRMRRLLSEVDPDLPEKVAFLEQFDDEAASRKRKGS